jgi:hypothetical protein
MGEAFIDDYISTQEQVYVVYLKFSSKLKENLSIFLKLW